MNLALSPTDRSRLGSAVRLLLSPLAHADLDAWRSSVNRSLKELLGADIATFVLPAEGVEAVFTEDIDSRAAAEYTDREPALPGDFTMWESQARVQVWNRARLYGPHVRAYYQSEYYNDFVVPLRGYDALGATISLNGRAGSTSLASILFHHERPGGRRFGARGLELLQLCFPAFESGTRTFLRLGARRETLMRTLDATGGALLLLDRSGRELHRTAALCRTLEADPELRASGEIGRLALALAGAGRKRAGSALLQTGSAVEIRTRSASYRLRGSYLGTDSEARTILLTLERQGSEPVCEDRLREEFGLTRQEFRVARLLVARRSNREIAEALVISPHTARHHTESVLQKLGVNSRKDVAPILRRPRP